MAGSVCCVFGFAPLAALAFNGISMGANLFASGVDARTLTLMRSLEQENKSSNKNQKSKGAADSYAPVLKAFFPVWWPRGAETMIPIGMGSILSNALAYLHTSCPLYAVATAGQLFIMGWTKIIMWEDIERLTWHSADMTEQELWDRVRTFCARHHVRTVVASCVFGISLYKARQGAFSVKCN
eukprot:Nk52_evm10s48 gene=Nk52_evmTU10s48